MNSFTLKIYSFCNENILIILKILKKNFVCLNDFVSLPQNKKRFVVIKSPHIFNKSREHFEINFSKKIICFVFNFSKSIFFELFLKVFLWSILGFQIKKKYKIFYFIN